MILVVSDLIKTTVNDVLQMRCQSKDTARRLTTNHIHHKRNEPHVIKLSKRVIFELQNLIMDFSLCLRETGFHSKGTSNAEVLNILSSGSVQHCVKAV